METNILQNTSQPPPPPMRDKFRKRKGGPTMAQIISDPLTQLSLNVWAPQVPLAHRCYFPDLINDIYYRECIRTGFSTRRLMVLELSQYLENYLWPNYNPMNATHSHVMSIVSMVNEKFREGINPWWVFEQTDKRLFAAFFNTVLNKSLAPEKEVSMREQISILVFLIHCFNSLSVDLVREHVWKLLSFSTWVNLLPSRLAKELHQNSELKKHWSKLQNKETQMDEKSRRKADKDRRYMYRLFNRYLSVLRRIPSAPSRAHRLDVSYCERFIEMLIDLEAQLPTRRYFNTQLDNSHLVVFSSLAPLVSRVEGKLFSQLLDILKFYTGFEISDHTGQPLTIHKMTDLHYNRIASLQRAAFKNYSDLRDFALRNISAIDTRESLKKHFSPLPYDSLHNIASFLCLVPPLSEVGEKRFQKVFLIEMIVSHHERRISQLDLINQTPLYPDEKILWDENVVPSEYYTGDDCLALPKLNLQFLTLHDYLLRNFQLFKLESTYEIRLDVEDAISRMKPRITPEGETVFHGWARMAQPIASLAVCEVGKPHIGDTWPSRVRANVTLHLNLQQNVREEWEALRKHDVCFLISVQPKISVVEKPDPNLKFAGQVGLLYVRGCEIEGMLDESGKIIEETQFDHKPKFSGVDRTFRVLLDPNQYQMDINNNTSNTDIYSTFNIFLRRKPKENNFKAVLDTTRDLMNSDCIVPEWIHNTFLGYGDPGDANYCKLPQSSNVFDFKDSFLSLQHLIDSFPQYRVRCLQEDPEQQVPPFRITFPETLISKFPEPFDQSQMSDVVDNILTIEAHHIPNRGPYPYDQPKFNTVLFTPTQIEAIVSGMHEGLTMVVGPPGTGKTDVAVQIISNLYHNFPQQRTLIVTHSNQALNQLFEKIMCLDIQERHLLRLGHGEESLETEKDFSRFGRVNYILQMRLDLLNEVRRLQESLDVSGDVSYTCETAGHFFVYQVKSRWEKYQHELQSTDGSEGDISKIKDNFPFHSYFSNAPQPLFKGKCLADDWGIAEGCFSHIQRIFDQLKEFRAFELLRSGMDRTNYLMIKTAKIIAMTCTHAAMKRSDFVELGFTYDNVIMEEAAQILEVETFIPLMLQKPEFDTNRLKRIILIGDHNQLPPVIKNVAFQKFSNMEQSLFTRFIRLGVPAVHLDAQGRARPTLRELYSWRYEQLGDLPHILRNKEYQCANPGFCFDYQVINVDDFNSRGEHEPNPYFYQNLGEAEFAVALFMYMRLQGYPPEKITILSTYNGQKHLIRDILRNRCADNPAFGLPEKVTTVDRYQGQQNDYIILSLVRTKTVGHLRDVRRLVVAMSRARLGLYVFARVSLFQNCYELSPAFRLLMQRPLSLHLCPMEFYASSRLFNILPPNPILIIRDMPHLANFVFDEYNRRLTILCKEQGKESLMMEPGMSLPAANLTESTIEKYQLDLEEGELAPEEVVFSESLASKVDDNLIESAKHIMESLRQYNLGMSMEDDNPKQQTQRENVSINIPEYLLQNEAPPSPSFYGPSSPLLLEPQPKMDFASYFLSNVDTDPQ